MHIKAIVWCSHAALEKMVCCLLINFFKKLVSFFQWKNMHCCECAVVTAKCTLVGVDCYLFTDRCYCYLFTDMSTLLTVHT